MGLRGSRDVALGQHSELWASHQVSRAWTLACSRALPGSSLLHRLGNHRLVARTRSGLAVRTVTLLPSRGLRHDPAPSLEPNYPDKGIPPTSSFMAAESIVSTCWNRWEPSRCLPPWESRQLPSAALLLFLCCCVLAQARCWLPDSDFPSLLIYCHST